MLEAYIIDRDNEYINFIEKLDDTKCYIGKESSRTGEVTGYYTYGNYVNFGKYVTDVFDIKDLIPYNRG